MCHHHPNRLMRVYFLVSLLGLSLLMPVLSAQTLPAQSAQDLVRDVIYNGLHDTERDLAWEFYSHRITPGKDTLRDEIETPRGPLYRALEQDGKPLDADQQKKEDARLSELAESPSELARLRRDHDADDDRLRSLMKMMPDAFLYSYDGVPEGDRVRLAFRPNPAYSPNTYEARVAHELTGTMVVNLKQKRMISMRGALMAQVDFGFGLLGHVDKGGTFAVERVQVSPAHWKTSLIEVHVRGKILLFSSMSRDQKESRWGFHELPADVSFPQVKEILDRATIPADAETVADGH
uniref:Uncharacterized protein n=2 Tax=Paracidobacterium acidisoli TaxID=2303751 RepID=A0A372IT79_9BACT